jgi:hypothetical protein
VEYQKLKQFLNEEMRMSQVYQPVMLIELLRNNGKASVTQIAMDLISYAMVQKNPRESKSVPRKSKRTSGATSTPPVKSS